MLYMIATIKEGKQIIGYRLLNTSDRRVTEVEESILKQKIKDNEIEVSNLRYYNRELLGINGTVARYPVLDNNFVLKGKSSLIILGKTEDNKFICSNYIGKIASMGADDIIKYGTKNGIANGKIIRGIISAIEGGYPIISKKENNLNKFRGCLFGGALGDALGYPIEFKKHHILVKRYGEEGLTEPLLGFYGKAEVSDDTQMTLFTAEGMLIGWNKLENKQPIDMIEEVYHSYMRWANGQGYVNNDELTRPKEGNLINVKEATIIRAPGRTCVTTLQSGIMGTIEKPINDSKGNGGVMRVAPVGLVYSKNEAFDMASKMTAITHGHPSGYLAAGAFAYIISALLEGINIEQAVNGALYMLDKQPNSEECIKKIETALLLLKSSKSDIESIEEIGEGWIAEEALAISIYCAIKYKDDYKKAVIVAVNHSGDSDSTGSITGNMVGLMVGFNKLPEDWVANIELKSEIGIISDGLYKMYRSNSK